MYASLEDLSPSLENPGIEDALQAAQRLVDDWGIGFAGLYLYGTPGTGKTHAALGIARRLHDAGADVFYRFAPRLDPDMRFLNAWTDNAGPKFANRVTSIFPIPRSASSNPRTVLLFDEYQPDKQSHLHSAVEAAAQYGGLIIVTSNFTDPFEVFETQEATPSTVNQALSEVLLTKEAPDMAQNLAKRRQEAAVAISASLRSRITAGFKLIEFTGPDRRLENGFWDS